MIVRKLEKIEKEMGYCEIKLEKERRLRKQVAYLRADLEVFERFDELYGSKAASGLDLLPYAKIGSQIAAERQSDAKPGPCFKRAREDFIAAGLLELVREERSILTREVSEVEAKFSSFSDFDRKRAVLEEEKREALAAVAPHIHDRVRRLNDEFKDIEHRWNTLTEDALNFDESIFFLARNVDYLTSSRSFLIAAKGSFDVETWIEDGYSTNIFRHSNIGRAKEMIEGAHRNLMLAQKGLVCVASQDFEIESFEGVLVRFLAALFEDIFLDARLDRVIEVVEEVVESATERLAAVRAKREQLHKELERAEATRVDLFSRMGGSGDRSGVGLS